MVMAPAAADALAASAFDFCSSVAALADNDGLVFCEPATVATSGWLMFCCVDGVIAEASERARCAGADGASAGPSSAFCWAASRRAADEGVGAASAPAGAASARLLVAPEPACPCRPRLRDKAAGAKSARAEVPDCPEATS